MMVKLSLTDGVDTFRIYECDEASYDGIPEILEDVIRDYVAMGYTLVEERD